jgi:chitin disaccharide deacetylase
MNASAMRRIWLNADDYGISPGVNGAIRDLIARRRINATSVMVVAHAFNRTEAKALMDAAAQGKGFIGLHLVLTSPFNPLTLHFSPLRDHAFVPQNEMLLSGFLHKLDREIVQAEIEAQIIAFRDAFGQNPAFVDGHLHCQLYPVVRDAVVAAVKAQAPSAWVRQCRRLGSLGKRFTGPKELFLDWLSTGLAAKARAAGLDVNPGFSGAYDFSRSENFSALFDSFLDGLPDGGVIMCHPGVVDDVLRQSDNLLTPREHEYAYLGGDVFPQRLAGANVTLL